MAASSSDSSSAKRWTRHPQNAEMLLSSSSQSQHSNPSQQRLLKRSTFSAWVYKMWSHCKRAVSKLAALKVISSLVKRNYCIKSPVFWNVSSHIDSIPFLLATSSSSFTHRSLYPRQTHSCTTPSQKFTRPQSCTTMWTTPTSQLWQTPIYSIQEPLSNGRRRKWLRPRYHVVLVFQLNVNLTYSWRVCLMVWSKTLVGKTYLRCDDGSLKAILSSFNVLSSSKQ